MAGFGDFSGNPNETDMLMQAVEWTVAGIAADPPAVFDLRKHHPDLAHIAKTFVRGFEQPRSNADPRAV